jgi:hypothetical protein
LGAGGGGFGPNPPNPNPQSPIPNPQYYINRSKINYIKNLINQFFLFLKKC